jgi:hypothetical protein
MRASQVIRSAALGVAVGGLVSMGVVGLAPAANAGTNSHFSSIVVALNGSGPPPGCPVQTGPNAIVSDNGNGVMHGETNKNGDWGGETFEGTAVFEYVPNGFTMDLNGNPIPIPPVTPLYSGHLQVWGGGGNNAGGQSTNGGTWNYQGTAISPLAPSATIHIHVNGQTTTNNNGNLTANFRNVSCTA